MNNIIFFKTFSLTHQSEFIDWLIVFFANPFIYISIFIAFVFLIFYTDGVFDRKNLFWKYNFILRLKNILFVLSSTVVAWGITDILKSIIASPRPFIIFDNLNPLFLHGGMDSFPSGHATFFGALSFSLFLINKKVGILFMIGALLVGFARIASGVHFPIDILFGYIVGFIIVLIFNLIFKAKFIDRLLAIFTKTL